MVERQRARVGLSEQRVMDDLAKRVAGLPPAKLELLLRRLRERGGGAHANQQGVVRRAEPGRPARLSFAQERLWFLSQLEPGSAAYNVFRAVRLTGELDAATLERSLSEIVRRHEVLRTTFAEVGGSAVQLVSPVAGMRLPLVDLSALPERAREAAVLALALEEGRRPFDLSTGPLFRITLLRLGRAQHVALFTMHHVIGDAWSMQLLMDEMAALYGAFSQGRESPLKELPVQYADYAEWQREYMRGEVLEGQLAYWKRQLGGGLQALRLPFDGPQTSSPGERGARRIFSVDAGLTDSLRALCRSEGVTMFMLALAAFKTLLYRYSRQEEIVVGSPIVGRNRVEVERLIGLFINTLVLRTSFSGDPTFRELLGRVREVTLGAYAHRDLPFEKLVQALEPERTLHRTLLFQAGFNFRGAPRESAALPHLSLDYMQVYSGKTQFELNMHVVEGERTLEGSLEYKTDLLTGHTAGRMLADFDTFLRVVAARPEMRLSELDKILDESDAHERAARDRELEELRAQKFKQARRRAVVKP